MSKKPPTLPPVVPPATPPIMPAAPTPTAPTSHGPDIWHAWAQAMPDATQPAEMPRGFSPAAGWAGLHAQRARADAAKAAAKAAAEAAASMKTELAAMRAAAERSSVESYLAGRGVEMGPRGAKFLMDQWRSDQVGVEKPVEFAAWVTSDDVVKDPFLGKFFSLGPAESGEGTSGGSPGKPKTGPPDSAGGSGGGGKLPKIPDLTKLTPAEVLAMVNAKQVTEEEYFRQLGTMG